MKKNWKPSKNRKIALIGEHPNNDAEAMKTLLKKHKLQDIDFHVIMKNQQGSKMLHERFFRRVKIEIENENFSHIIVLKDADCIFSETNKIEQLDR